MYPMRVRTETIVLGALLLGVGILVSLAIGGVASGRALSVAGLVLIWWGFSGPWLERFARETVSKDEQKDTTEARNP